MNQTIKQNLETIDQKNPDQSDFLLIGKAKKAMNQYLQFYYKDDHDNAQGFKVGETFQDKERKRTMQLVQRNLVDQRE